MSEATPARFVSEVRRVSRTAGEIHVWHWYIFHRCDSLKFLLWFLYQTVFIFSILVINAVGRHAQSVMNMQQYSVVAYSSSCSSYDTHQDSASTSFTCRHALLTALYVHDSQSHMPLVCIVLE